MTDPNPQPMLGRPRRSPWTRRLVTAIVILGVAGGVTIVSNLKQARRVEVIRTAVIGACAQIVLYRDEPDVPLHADIEDFIGPGLRGPIASALPEGELDLAVVEVTVLLGDDPPPNGDGRATHRAIIDIRGRAVLILRIHQGDVPTDLHVLGYRALDSDQPVP